MEILIPLLRDSDNTYTNDNVSVGSDNHSIKEVVFKLSNPNRIFSINKYELEKALSIL